MERRWLISWLLLLIVSWAAGADAGTIEERVNRHVEAAVKDGVQPADYHHLFFAFSWRATLSDWNLAERALDRLAGARQVDPLMADELRLDRARLELDQGRDAAARELFRSMGGLSSWWFAGPEPLEELHDFDLAAASPPQEAAWRAVAGTDSLGWVRLSGLAWPAQRQMAYLATTVTSDSEQPVAIRLGAAQVARAWLNGVELLTSPQPLQRAEDQVAGGGWLRQGRNTLVVAVASEDERWWLRARLTRPNGESIDGVREVREPPGHNIAVDREPPEVRELGAEIDRKSVV